MVPPGRFKVVYRYCSARDIGQSDSQPDQEAVVRTLCRQLAWLPVFSVAQSALQFQGEWQQRQQQASEKPLLKDWQDLLRDLLKQHQGQVVIAIDALDECTEPNPLLEFLQNVVASRPNVHILCSSRQNILVERYFHYYDGLDKTVEDVDISRGESSGDMFTFVEHAIEIQPLNARRESIFCECCGSTQVAALLIRNSPTRSR